MIYTGDKKTKKCYLGDDSISRVYLGDELLFAKMSRLPAGYTDSAAFAMELVDKTGMLVTPGSAFGPGGEGHVRMALVRTEEEIKACIKAVAECGILNK